MKYLSVFFARLSAVLERLQQSRLLYGLVVLAVLLLFAVRFIHLGADFHTTEKRFAGDGVLYTDEGWYANNAIYFHRLGTFYREGESNFGVNLPVLQGLHTVSFFFFGPTIIGARMTILVFFAATLLLLFHILRRLEDSWTALIALFWIVGNYFYFLHSRFAIAEMPMTFFVTLCLYLAYLAKGPRGLWLAALSGLCFGIAMYTKTSAIFAFPLMLGIMVLRNWDEPLRWRKWAAPAVAVAVFAFIALLHTLLLARRFPADYAFFNSINVGLNLKFSLQESAAHAWLTYKRLSNVDSVMHDYFPFMLLGLLFFSRDFRRNPLMWLCLIWIVSYLSMFVLYMNLKPRYWAALFVPFGTFLAICLKHVYLLGQRHSWVHLFTAWFIVAFLVTLAEDVNRLKKYFRNIDYSFAEMSADVKRILDEDPESRNIILGHFVTTIALYEDVIPVNDRYAPTPLEDRLEEYRPRYLLTEGDLYERDWIGFATDAVHADDGGERHAALLKYYDKIEHVKDYEVFRNYMGWPVKLYRLERTEDGATEPRLKSESADHADKGR